jgi:hypothetical protein
MAISKKIKKAVEQRAKGCCEYCQCVALYIPVPFTMEHIIPQVHGGSDDVDNLAFACGHCNGAKYSKIEAKDEITNSVVRLFHPRRDVWKNHFKWNEDFSKIIGITPTGRATVLTLNINREKVINFRLLLFPFGFHPPSHTL